MRRILAFAVAAGSMLAFVGSASAECTGHRIGALDQLKIRTFAGQQGRAEVADPLKDKTLTDCDDPTLCWLTAEQAANGRECKTAMPPDKSVGAFAAGAKTEGDGFKVLQTGQPEKSLRVTSLPAIIVTYSPDGLTARDDEAVLQIEWKKGDSAKTDKYFVHGHAEAYQDARYRISLWAGGAYLYSKNNFSQGFPELRLLVETRARDPYQRYEHCSMKPAPEPCAAKRSHGTNVPGPLDPNIRLYGDLGLTSTTASSDTSEASFKGMKAFDVSGALGLGPTFLVAPKDPAHDTFKFSVLLIARVGIVSLPDASAVTGPLTLPDQEPLPFGSSFGFRVENENGHFAGAYTEIGYGQSNRFVHQKSKRLKVDLFLPFTEPNTVRLAARAQIDRPFPGSDLNEGCYSLSGAPATTSPEPCPGGGKITSGLLRAGDVKISLLFNIDIRTVFDMLGAATAVKPGK